MGLQTEDTSSVDRATLRAVLRLALGLAVPDGPLDWSAIFALAQRERVLGLIWKRSGEALRRCAPAAIAQRWRSRALSLGLRADGQLRVLHAVTQGLLDRGVAAVVLKGLPLAESVYGDFTVRSMSDLDIYIPASQRQRAEHALREMGWQWTNGTYPEEQTFELALGDESVLLEVHSSALDDRLLNHLHLPIEAGLVSIRGLMIPAHCGPFVPAFLAAHLVKHHQKRLLWVLDFFFLWTSLDSGARQNAIGAARSAGLARHLRWTIRLSEWIEAGRADGFADPTLREIERALGPTSDLRRLGHLLSLSGTPLHAMRVLGGRIWAGAFREGWHRAPSYFMRRVLYWSYRRVALDGPPSDDTRRAAIPLASADCAERLRAAMGASSFAWVSPPDAGMEPAIPRYGLARIVAAGSRSLRVGDVVVLDDQYGRCTLRRVLSLGADTILTTRDAQNGSRLAAPLSAVIGVCDLVDVGATTIPIEERPYGMSGLVRAILRARWTSSFKQRSA
jgi:Uncharacterised nucleotidyltransferase